MTIPLKKVCLVIAVGTAAALLPALVDAATPPPSGTLTGVASGFRTFMTQTQAALTTAVSSPAITAFPRTLYYFFAFLLIIWNLWLYAMRGLTLQDVVNTALLLLFTRFLMRTYPVLTEALWGWSVGFGDAVQTALLGNADLFYGPNNIFTILSRLDLDPRCNGFVCGLQDLLVMLDVFIVYALAAILSAIAVIAVIWSFWGYALAKIIGLMFIPFLLFERLAFLFDGWVRFLFGFLIYGVLARANVALATLAIAAFFHVPVGAMGTVTASTIVVDNLMSVVGLLIFMMIGLFALFSTGRFAGSVVTGAASGGVGAAFYSMVRAVSRVVR